MGRGGGSWLMGGRRVKNTRQDEESGQDDVKRQIDSDLSDSKRIYQLADVKTGGGKLIDIVKNRARHQSFYSSSSISLDRNREDSKRFRNSDDERAFQDIDGSIDEQIYKLVVPLLYNGGRGRLIPLEHIWRYRFAGCRVASASDDDILGPEFKSSSSSTHVDGPTQQQRHSSEGGPQERLCRWVCWRLEERGFVGETALHICFLLSTPTHMILAQKLLRLFPMLINDIYTCDQYFGESSLHMAIVNEDVKILKLLLDHGANVHERCLGSFFLPDDQKDRANGPIKQFLLEADEPNELAANQFDLNSNHLGDPQTNYEGYTYWGEYPLSFAASLGLADCYQLLQAKGADPNLVDSNGNSTLHICVIANRIDMFNLCYSNGANLSARNRLGFSPLTLAAKLRRVQMFFHILTIMRQVNWIFCNVGFVDIPLDEIDSINTSDGSCNDHSVLSIVVSGNSNEHLRMLDGLLSDLLRVKWKTSVRGIFRTWLMMFTLFLIISSVAYLTRVDIHKAERLIRGHAEETETANTSNVGHSKDPPTALRVAQSYVLTNQISELLVVCCVAYYLIILTTRYLVEASCRSAKSTGGGSRILAQAPELVIFTITCLLILACIPLRLWLRWRQTEDFLAAVVMFLLPLKLLFFCRGSKSLGSFIVMIYKILVNDVLCFVVFLIIFIAGFGQSFVLIFKTYRPDPTRTNANSSVDFFESLVRGDESYFLNFYDSFITLHMMALNEFSWVVDEFKATEYPNLARVLFCVYMVLVSILLVNMLIAMLGKTYQDIASQPNENLRQWARALLTVERMCSRRTRLEMLNEYSMEKRRPTLAGEQDGNGAKSSTALRRCYNSTWALADKDMKEINTINRLISEHQLNASRRVTGTTRS